MPYPHPEIIMFAPAEPAFGAALNDMGLLAVLNGAFGLAVQMTPAALRALADRANLIADAIEAHDTETVRKVDAALDRIVGAAGHA
jgi:hypothetical protein